jgi:hypothetical protein
LVQECIITKAADFIEGKLSITELALSASSILQVDRPGVWLHLQALLRKEFRINLEENHHFQATVRLLFQLMSFKLSKVAGVQKVVDVVYEYIDLVDLLLVKKEAPKLLKMQGDI